MWPWKSISRNKSFEVRSELGIKNVSECIGNKFELNTFKFNPIFEKYMEPRKNILD